MADAKTKAVEPAKEPEKSVKLAASKRFTDKVLKEFESNVAGKLQVTDYQRALIQGYFVCIDRALDVAEENRLYKNGWSSEKNDLPTTWENINMADLAIDIAHYSKMGLDMMQANHLFPIPYKNKKINKYDVTLIPGYNGIKYIAEKYAVEKPVAVTVELVYSTDKFRPIKKSAGSRVETYEFEITNAFDRGTVIGGFGYIEYADSAKNELVIMTKADIEKRKPSKAAAEFWGGKKKEKVDGKWTEVDTPGWYEEMCRKTIIREVYGAKHMPCDPKKIDDAYQYIKMRETHYAELEAEAEIEENANGQIIDTEIAEPETSTLLIDTSTGEVTAENSTPDNDFDPLA